MRKNILWKNDEIDYIKSVYNGRNIDELAEFLERTPVAVLNKLKRINVYQKFVKKSPRLYKANTVTYSYNEKTTKNRTSPITSTTLSIIAISDFEGYSIKRISNWLGLNPICTAKIIGELKLNGLYDHFLSILKINNYPLYLRATNLNKEKVLKRNAHVSF